MTTDDRVKSQIDKLKATWTAENFPPHKRPGKVKLWVPIDKDTKVAAQVSGRLISFLGITKDEFGTTHTQVLTSDKETEENREVTDTFYTSSETLIHREIYVDLANPIPSPTDKHPQRLIKQVLLRLPNIVTVDAINYFLYNACGNDDRPPSFTIGEKGRRNYFVSNIDLANLGTITNKAGTKVADTKFIKP